MTRHSRRADILAVFVKAPEPGLVKTRLAREIGEAEAARLFARLARAVIGSSSSPDDYQTSIWFAPAERGEAIRAWLHDLGVADFLPQTEGGLGERMSAAFDRHFVDGASRVVVIGSDCPGITRPLLCQAFAALDQNDVTLGPSEDGGFYLIGLAAPAPGLFQGIAWSTPAVYGQTVTNARRLGLSVAPLPGLRDIDTAEDARALGWLAALPARSPAAG